MPTVFRAEGFRFYFYSHEPNEPAHVHVDRAGATAKIWIERVELATASGFAPHDLAVLLKLTRTHRDFLLRSWHEFFGTIRSG